MAAMRATVSLSRVSPKATHDTQRCSSILRSEPPLSMSIGHGSWVVVGSCPAIDTAPSQPRGRMRSCTRSRVSRLQIQIHRDGDMSPRIRALRRVARNPPPATTVWSTTVPWATTGMTRPRTWHPPRNPRPTLQGLPSRSPKTGRLPAIHCGSGRPWVFPGRTPKPHATNWLFRLRSAKSRSVRSCDKARNARAPSVDVDRNRMYMYGNLCVSIGQRILVFPSRESGAPSGWDLASLPSLLGG